MRFRYVAAALVVGLLSLSPLPSAVAADGAGTEPPPVTFTSDPAPPGVRPSGPTAAPGATAAQAGLPIPALSSRPGSTHTIYLDFDGVTLTSASAWVPDVAAGTYGGYTLDGSSDFSATEVDAITRIWRMTAEKFSTYDINVTTVDPGQAALARADKNDPNYGVQVVFSDDGTPRSQLCGTCAGIAWNDTFDGRIQSMGQCLDVCDYSGYTVAWVFTSALSGSAQMAMITAAHEVGHTLGLDHDGLGGSEYYGGHANWTPIMGYANQTAISQFSEGEYSGATNTQDDLEVVSVNGNSGLVGSLTLADDYTTSGGAPTGSAILGSSPPYELDGKITNTADDDLFSITRTSTAPLCASASGIGAGQSVDLKVEIQNAAGTVLASDDPVSGDVWNADHNAYEPTGMDASASLPSTTNGATYRIKVDGVGTGDPSTAYSDYGSIGPYHLVVNDCVLGNKPGPPASASAVPDSRATTGTVNWTAPNDNGGAPITGYLITGLPGGNVNVGNVLTYGATSLVPGTTYNVAVYAKNGVGTSTTPAVTTLKVDTWAPTTKPVLTAGISGSTASLSWTAPANPGGATLTGWRVVGTGASPVDQNLPAAPLSKSYTVGYGQTTYTVTGIYTATDTAGVVASDPKAVTRAVTAPGQPVSASTTPAVRDFTGSISWTAPADNGGDAVTNYRITGLPEGTVDLGNVLNYQASGLVPGTTYNLTILAKNSVGFGTGRTTSLRVATWAPTAKPGLTVTRSGTTATLTFTAPPNVGGAILTGWVIDRTGPGTTPADKSVPAGTTTTTMAGLAPGTQSFTVRAVYSADSTAGVSTSDPKAVLITTKPSAPRIGPASSGTAGGSVTAIARWAAPTSSGGTPITSYRVYAYKLNAKNQIIATRASTLRPASARSYVWALAAGRYRFRVVATNKVGTSGYSAYSGIVVAR